MPVRRLRYASLAPPAVNEVPYLRDWSFDLPFLYRYCEISYCVPEARLIQPNNCFLPVLHTCGTPATPHVPHNDYCVSAANGLKALNQQRGATPCETVPAQTKALKGRNQTATVEKGDCAPSGLDDRFSHIRRAMPCAVEDWAFSPLESMSFLSCHCERSEAIHIRQSNCMASICPVRENMLVENNNTGISPVTPFLLRHCERSEAIHIRQSNCMASICPVRDNMLVENSNTGISPAVPLGTECGLLRTHYIPADNHNNHAKITVQTNYGLLRFARNDGAVRGLRNNGAKGVNKHAKAGNPVNSKILQILIQTDANDQSRRDFHGFIAVGFSQRKQVSHTNNNKNKINNTYPLNPFAYG